MTGPRAPSTLLSYTSSREDVAALVPAAARKVLDVGCASGALGAALKAAAPREVVGIELDPGFAAAAAPRLDRVLAGDALEALGTLAGEGARFDCVVCADVLEHLVEPEAALAAATAVLAPDGTVVVSLPNVRWYGALTTLAFRGTWPRRDRGLHDRTHLRWFTDRDARAMFAAAGLRPVATRAHFRLRDAPGGVANRLAPLVARGPLRGFLAYQHLYVLVRASATTAATTARS